MRIVALIALTSVSDAHRVPKTFGDHLMLDSNRKKRFVLEEKQLVDRESPHKKLLASLFLASNPTDLKPRLRAPRRSPPIVADEGDETAKQRGMSNEERIAYLNAQMDKALKADLAPDTPNGNEGGEKALEDAELQSMSFEERLEYLKAQSEKPISKRDQEELDLQKELDESIPEWVTVSKKVGAMLSDPIELGKNYWRDFTDEEIGTFEYPDWKFVAIDGALFPFIIAISGFVLVCYDAFWIALDRALLADKPFDYFGQLFEILQGKADGTWAYRSLYGDNPPKFR